MKERPGALSRFSALFLLFLLSVTVHAAPLAFSADSFKKQVGEALAEEEEDKLIRTLTSLHGKMRTAHYPNCFECSLWLMSQASNTSPTKRLILAEYASRFAPDLPETHLNRLVTVLSEQPSDISLVTASFGRWFSTALRWVQRDVFIGGLLRFVLVLSAAMFIGIAVIMSFKYGSAIAHLYSHVGTFSLFHKTLGVVVAGTAALLAFKQVIGPEIFFLLWILFCYRVARYREIALLIFLLGGYLVSDTAIALLSRSAPDMSGARWDIFNTVYNPLSPREVPDDKTPASLFSRGMQSFYEQKWETADRLLASCGRDLKNSTELARIVNLRGIIAGENGKREMARKLFTEAVKHDERPEYLFNLSRAFYAEGNLREAEEVEMRSVALGGKSGLDYPALVLPFPYEFARSLSDPPPSSDPLHDPLLIRLSATILLILVAGLLWRVVGPRTTVARCVECGGILCEECGGETEGVCLVCRILKAGKGLLSPTEQKHHVEQRERWSAQRRTLSVLLSIVIPGGGLLYSGHFLEGFFFLFACAFLALSATAIAAPHFLGTPESFSALPTGIVMAFVGLAIVLWIGSLLRSWRAAGTDE